MADNNRRKRKAEETNLDAQDWNKLTVADLRVELERRGLPTVGKKAVLVSYLQDNDGDNASGSGSGHVDIVDNVQSSLVLLRQEAFEGVTKKSVKKVASKKTTIEKTGWSSKTVTELKVECRDRDLSPAGGKADLVERLEDDDAEKAIITAVGYVPRSDENATRTGEKRYYPFESRPDSDFKERYKKAKRERMIMLGRKKGSDPQGDVNETFMIAGSQGSVYTTTIGTMYKCDCQDFKFRGIRCKHVIYALVVILKALTDIASQKALLPCEVKEIFRNAPVTQELHFDVQEEAHPGVRKPIEGDCPICVFEFDVGEEILWCKGACGQNVHKACFEQWKAAKQGDFGGVKCVYCRTPWMEGGSGEGLSGIDALVKSAPKIGWHKNIAHLDVYKNAPPGSQN